MLLRPAARPRASGAGTVPTPPGRHTERQPRARTVQRAQHARAHGGTRWGWWWALKHTRCLLHAGQRNEEAGASAGRRALGPCARRVRLPRLTVRLYTGYVCDNWEAKDTSSKRTIQVIILSGLFTPSLSLNIELIVVFGNVWKFPHV